MTVTGETPIVDTQTTRRETVLSNDVINVLPASRGYGALLTAIPALMMFHYLTNRVEEMTVDIADASNELVDFFLKEGRFDEPLTNPGANKQAGAAATAPATVRPPQPKA